MALRDSLNDLSLSSPVVWVLVLVIAGSVLGGYYLFWGGVSASARSYDWTCAKCGYSFQSKVPPEAVYQDQSQIRCPKCGQNAAERIVHLTCAHCGHRWDIKGHGITLEAFKCPKCRAPAPRLD